MSDKQLPTFPAQLASACRGVVHGGAERRRVVGGWTAVLGLAVLLWLGVGCSSRTGYRPDASLLHKGDFSTGAPDRAFSFDDSLTVVSYNIQYGENIEAALADLRRAPRLDHADVILLQEMDLAGVESLARDLNCHYVYHAASVHPHHGRLFGNAVLSPWAIVDQQLVVLPHGHPLTGQKRIAVAALLDVDGAPLRVVSIHSATVILELEGRLDQATALLDSLAQGSEPVIVGGDFNTATDHGRVLTQRIFRRAGFRRAGRPTQATVRKKLWFRPSERLILDHIFYRGLEEGSAGVRIDATASDHYPLWARFGRPAPPD